MTKILNFANTVSFSKTTGVYRFSQECEVCQSFVELNSTTFLFGYNSINFFHLGK